MQMDPEEAVKSMIKRNPAADLALETRRLKLAIDVQTDYVNKKVNRIPYIG